MINRAKSNVAFNVSNVLNDQDVGKGLLTNLIGKVEGIMFWGAQVDEKQGQLQSCMDMVLTIQKTLVEKLGV